MKRTWMRRRSPKQAAFERAYAPLRAAILERDGHRCRRCGCGPQGPEWCALEVHHVIKRSHAKALRLDADNLITLCRSCHAWTDESYGGWRGRLVIVALGAGDFSMRVMRGTKSAPFLDRTSQQVM